VTEGFGSRRGFELRCGIRDAPIRGDSDGVIVRIVGKPEVEPTSGCAVIREYNSEESSVGA
jgi:hypothetical protein